LGQSNPDITAVITLTASKDAEFEVGAKENSFVGNGYAHLR
jgi:hypothetical protein